MGSAGAYAVGGTHRHTPEITQNLRLLTGADVRVSFTPMLVPMSRGILATCTAPTTGRRGRRPRGVREGLRRRAVRAAAAARGSGRRPRPTLGANTAHVQVTVDEAAGRLVAVAAIDNLAKGTAGAAIQCINIALGLAEDRRPDQLNGVAP